MSTVHGQKTIIFPAAMKSQDILLLLKLSSLERQGRSTSSAALSEPPENFAEEISSLNEPIGNSTGNHISARLEIELDPYSVRGLSSATGISKSEVSNALRRCYTNGLAKRQLGSGSPIVNRRGLEEFLSYGIRYVFPANTSGLALGTPTGLTAPIFEGILRSAGEYSPVWPDPHGSTLGLVVEPLYKTVTSVIRNDETLYKLLAIVDSIRLGLPRERKLAIAQLQELLNF